MQKSNSLTTPILFLALSAVVLFASLYPNKVKNLLGLTPAAPIVLPVSDCDLAKSPCRYELNIENAKGSLTISLQPRPLQPTKPMTVEVLLENLEGIAVGINFVGADMDMGPNITPLTRMNYQYFSGQASLPVCISGKMRWNATVQLETRNQRTDIPFTFEIGE